MSQYHGHPRSQNTAAGTPEPSPEISSQQPYPCNHQQDSGFFQPPAPFSQQLLSLSASRYAPNEHPLDWEILQSLSFQQDADSQAVHQQFQPSDHVTTTTPNCHPLSDQRYSEKVIHTSSRGVGYPVLGEHLHDHNGDNSVWSSMDDLSLQNVQGSSIEPYNTSFEGYGDRQDWVEEDWVKEDWNEEDWVEEDWTEEDWTEEDCWEDCQRLPRTAAKE
ncbi:MAG: hypothetical protein Q9161_007779 [Pseudevernia consocians]